MLLSRFNNQDHKNPLEITNQSILVVVILKILFEKKKKKSIIPPTFNWINNRGTQQGW